MHFNMTGIHHQPSVVRPIHPLLQQALPNSFIAPATKTAVGVLPATIIRRQITPQRTRTQYPEHGVDKAAVIFSDTAPATCTTGRSAVPIIALFSRKCQVIGVPEPLPSSSSGGVMRQR